MFPEDICLPARMMVLERQFGDHREIKQLWGRAPGSLPPGWATDSIKALETGKDLAMAHSRDTDCKK